jgi:hypothetical protein
VSLSLSLVLKLVKGLSLSFSTNAKKHLSTKKYEFEFEFPERRNSSAKTDKSGHKLPKTDESGWNVDCLLLFLFLNVSEEIKVPSLPQIFRNNFRFELGLGGKICRFSVQTGTFSCTLGVQAKIFLAH